MGMKRKIPCISYDNAETLSVPPGFASLTSFTLKKVADSGEATDLMVVDRGFKPEPNKMGSPLNNADIENFKASFRLRPWILHSQFDRVSEKCDSEIGMNFPLRAHLPKGVIRGCPTCHECQKVIARWRPEESRLPVLEDAPVFYPTEGEFEDMLKYVAKIRPKVENYGICRIVSPPSWHPPCLLKEKMTWETPKFDTYSQQIDGLQHLYLKRKLCRFHEKMETKRPKILSEDLESSADTDEAKCFTVSSDFDSGPEFTLQSFKKHADEFKRQYFRVSDMVTDPNVSSNAFLEQHEPSLLSIEGEYWRIIENPSEEIEVLCGNNLKTQALRSGFPVKPCAEYSKYAESDWNLNNIPKLPGSLLPFESCDISAILVPQLSMGMCFASHCWRTEEHHLYSICYMHLGSPKIWYGIPGRYCFKFVEFVKKQFPQLCLSDHPELLHELVTQFSPSTLMSEGIPVYRCVQNPLEFVVIFPGAYHSEFDCGFNSSESVHFAPFDWLPHGQYITELYSEHYRKTSISHDKLLLGAAKVAARVLWESSVLRKDNINHQIWKSVCEQDGILVKALKSRVKLEGIRREHLLNRLLVSRRLEDDSMAATKRECSICLYDLYLSAIGCSCSPNRYACMRHSKQLCSCPWSAKCFYFRYGIEELNSLVAALEGNIKAIHIWAKKKV
ncbi:putative lysine-specific demethylase JMJ16 [Forsythia ovata]|uniref:Lysine-specific demethylase JMJ16 n=1 Tax=Forsythia ovata TaxID=205694 RepID=A0ABD1VGW4_9LAMI